MFAIRDSSTARSSGPSPLTSGITATPVSKPESPSASFGKSAMVSSTIIQGLCCVAIRLRRQSPIALGCSHELHELPPDDDDVHGDVHDHQEHRHPDRFAKPAKKDASKRDEQEARHDDRMVDPVRHERVFDDVRRRVGGRERDRDDEAGRGEPEQAQNQPLASPARQQLLEDRQAALAVRAQARRSGDRRAARRTASGARAAASRTARGIRRRETRCSAGSRGSRSSRPP